MTYHIHYNPRDRRYHIDRVGHGYIASTLTLSGAMSYIVEGYGYEQSTNAVTIEYLGHLVIPEGQL